MRYLYRCDECGHRSEHEFPINKPIPELLPAIVAWDPAWHAPAECTGVLRRVYEPPATSLGPEYAKYSDNNGYIDQDKYYGRNWAREHNKLS